MRQTRIAATVKDYVAHRCGDAHLEAVAQTPHVLDALCEFCACKRSGFTEGDDEGDGLCARASFALLMPADVLRSEPHAAPDEECAHAFGRIELVRRER